MQGRQVCISSYASYSVQQSFEQTDFKLCSNAASSGEPSHYANLAKLPQQTQRRSHEEIRLTQLEDECCAQLTYLANAGRMQSPRSDMHPSDPRMCPGYPDEHPEHPDTGPTFPDMHQDRRSAYSQMHPTYSEPPTGHQGRRPRDPPNMPSTRQQVPPTEQPDRRPPHPHQRPRHPDLRTTARHTQGGHGRASSTQLPEGCSSRLPGLYGGLGAPAASRVDGSARQGRSEASGATCPACDPVDGADSKTGRSLARTVRGVCGVQLRSWSGLPAAADLQAGPVCLQVRIEYAPFPGEPFVSVPNCVLCIDAHLVITTPNSKSATLEHCNVRQGQLHVMSPAVINQVQPCHPFCQWAFGMAKRPHFEHQCVFIWAGNGMSGSLMPSPHALSHIHSFSRCQPGSLSHSYC